MNHKLLILSFLAIAVLAISAGVGAATVLTVDDSGGEMYTSIQAAINDANPGDEIQVYSGTYNEIVNVNKQLILRGTDTGDGKPVVDVVVFSSVIRLNADGIKLDGFIINSNYGSGILINSNNNILSNNIVNSREFGIYLESSNNNILKNNNAPNNKYGIYLGPSSNYNTLDGNIATHNYYGIYLSSVRNNTLIRNNLISNIYDGIYLGSSDNNILSGNSAKYNKRYGIALASSSKNILSDNKASNNKNGFYLESASNDNILSGNTAISNSNHGIYLFSSNNNTLNGNNASKNHYHGIYLYASINNTLSKNNVLNNTNGIYLFSSSNGNIIFHNNLVDNTQNANDRYVNQWDSGTEGNYWSDYTGTDSNGDGIGDTQYLIPTYGGSSVDRYPLIAPYSPPPSDYEGKLLRQTGEFKVYLIEDGKKRHFTSPEALEWNGHSFDDVIEVSVDVVNSFELGADISITQAIINKYNALGGAATFGPPAGTGEQTGYPDSAGVICTYVNFQNGAIEYFTNGDQAGNAYAILNPFFDKWASMGYAKSVLGYPISDMSDTQTSSFGTQFKYQNFMNGTESGALEYNLATGEVFEIHGAIYATWSAMGYANSILGLVTSDERDAVPSFKGTTGRVSDFENGHLHWHSSGDHYMVTYMTYGDLDELYVSMGGTASWLGFPVIHQEDRGGYGYCEFEGGYIEWDGSEYKAVPITGYVHNINKGTDYTTIQAAIDDASPSDEIHVDSGTYYENVVVNKQLILKGVDTGAGMPVVDAGGSGSAVTLSADGCVLEDFKITTNELMWNDAILVWSQNNKIKNNYIFNSYRGIRLYSSSHNDIANNVLTHNEIGILLDVISVGAGPFAQNNTIINNNISNNRDFGIYLVGSYPSYVVNNRIYHNNLINNNINATDCGSDNYWDNGYPSGGNYWGDYTGADLKNGANQDQPNSDGIGDTPYPILGGSSVDRYPLMNPWTAPPLSGKIAFATSRDGNQEVYVMNADDSGDPINLTNRPDADDGDPTWSPDGTQIAFSSNRSGNWTTYVMNADGSDQVCLLEGVYDAWGPAWSPDGTKIAVACKINPSDDFEIYTVDIQSRALTQVTDNKSSDCHPSWSPDSHKIVFTSDRDGNQEIYVADLLADTQTKLTDELAYDDYPEWSPDGSMIAFVSERDGNLEIYSMDIASKAITRLTYSESIDKHAQWSPDGQKIVFISDRDGGDMDVYVMKADGTSTTCLVDWDGDETHPTWSSGHSSHPTYSVGEGAPDSTIEQHFIDAYNRNGGVSVLGDPATEVHDAWGYLVQDFTGVPGIPGGVIMYNDIKDDAFYIHGAIWERYYTFVDKSELGPVASDEGEAAISPQGTTGRYSKFEYGTIHWISDDNADHLNKGKSFVTYSDLDIIHTDMGGTVSWLGFPVMDQIVKDDGYYFCEFEGGYIEWDEIRGEYKAIPFIAVTFPNGGEDWQVGTTYPIQWSYAGNLGSDVTIEILKGGSVVQTYTSIPIGNDGSGSFDWTIPSTLTLGTGYQVRITSTTNIAYTDTSNEPFVISVGYAIIVAGKGGLREQWSIDYGTTNAYRVLRNLGFDDNHIYYLSDRYQDVDGDGFNEVDAGASLSNFSFAIETISEKIGDNSGQFILYLHGHGPSADEHVPGDNPYFAINPETSEIEDYIFGLELQEMLGKFSSKTQILAIFGTCMSGLWITDDDAGISGSNRIIITASHDNEDRNHIGALLSSERFFQNLNKGLNVKEAYVEGMLKGDKSHLWLDDNGDRIGHPPNNLGNDGVLAASTQIGVEGTENLKFTSWLTLGLYSPGELRVYDSQNRVTGLVNGVIKEEIANSIYDEENIAIFSPFDTYNYIVTGTGSGIYGLEIVFVKNGEFISFYADDIPISQGQIHLYSIDWDMLSKNEKGVIVKIDIDGDGIFDKTITTNHLFKIYNITFLPPITTTDQFNLTNGRTLPIKFTAMNSTTGEFIYDDTVNVTITNSTGNLITYFTNGTGTDSVRINTEDEQYIVNFHSKNYELNVGETYTITVNFGELDSLRGYDMTYFRLVERGKGKG